MERTLTQVTVGPAARPLPLDLGRILPLWRFAVFTLCLFGVTAFAVAVRLDVQQMREDLDRNGRMQREARILNDRLHLEMDARRRATAVEVVARQLELGAEARIVRLDGASP